MKTAQKQFYLYDIKSKRYYFIFLKLIIVYLTGSEDTVQTMDTFFPLGTVRYIEVGDNSGSQANSAKLKYEIMLFI